MGGNLPRKSTKRVVIVAKKGGPTIVHVHLKALAVAAPRDPEARKAKRRQERIKITQERRATEKRKEVLRDSEEENPFDAV